MRWWIALSWALRIVGWLLLADAVGMATTDHANPVAALVKAFVGAWLALESRLPPPPRPPA